MALSAENIKAQFDVSSGYVASYPFTFKFWNTSEIKAVLTDGETNTPLVKDVDYSVSAPGSGGTITRLTTWPAALRLTVYREMPLSQDTDLVNGAIQDAELYEAALDRIVGEIQQLNENVARNIQTPMSDPAAQVITLPPAEQREGKLLGFEVATGRPIAVSGTFGETVVTPWAKTLLDDENAMQARGTMGVPEFSVNPEANKAPIRDTNGIVRNPMIDLRTGLVGAWASDLPEYPDNPAGATYFQDAWATTDSWQTGGTATLSVFDGVLKITATDTAFFGYRNITSTSAKTLRCKVRVSRTGTYNFNNEGGVTFLSKSLNANEWYLIDGYVAGTVTQIGVVKTAATAGDTIEIDWAYIGDGTYYTKARDISGGGKHLTVVGTTPTSDGGFQRDGVNDYEKTQDVVSMPDVFHYHEEWEIPNNATQLQIILGIATTGEGRLLLARGINSRMLEVYYWNGSASVTYSVANFFETNNEKVVADVYIDWTTKATKIYKNGLLFNTTTLTNAVKPTNKIWYFGNQSALSSLQACGGKLKGKRLYNRTLTDAAIWELANNPDAYRFDDSKVAVTAVPNAIPILTSEGYLAAAQMKATDILGKMKEVDVRTIVKLTSGSGNWTVPAGVTQLKVICVGGGAGGAGGTSTGGGGGGGTAISSVLAQIINVSPNEVIAYTVGAGGSGGASGASGTPGGTTTFGSISALGGRAGTNYARAGAGAPGSAGASGAHGGPSQGGNGGGAGGVGGYGSDLPGEGGLGGGGGGGGINKNGAAGGSGVIIIEY